MIQGEAALSGESSRLPASADRTAGRLRDLPRLARKYPFVALFSLMLLALLLVALLVPVLAPYSQFQTHPAPSLQSPSSRCSSARASGLLSG